MRKMLPILVLLPCVAGCTEDRMQLEEFKLSVEMERIDCLMKIVDDRSAALFCSTYHPKLKARYKVVKERADNMEKVWEKKDKEAFKEKEPEYEEMRKAIAAREAVQLKRITSIHKALKDEGEETPGLDKFFSESSKGLE